MEDHKINGVTCGQIDAARAVSFVHQFGLHPDLRRLAHRVLVDVQSIMVVRYANTGLKHPEKEIWDAMVMGLAGCLHAAQQSDIHKACEESKKA